MPPRGPFSRWSGAGPETVKVARGQRVIVQTFVVTVVPHLKLRNRTEDAVQKRQGIRATTPRERIANAPHGRRTGVEL